MTDVVTQVQRATIRRFDLASARITVLPEALDRNGTKVSAFQLGVGENPMDRAQLVEVRDLCNVVLDEVPVERIVAALDPVAGVTIPSPIATA